MNSDTLKLCRFTLDSRFLLLKRGFYNWHSEVYIKIKNIMEEENEIGKIQVKIVATQELINIEKDQTKKNELMHKLQILKFRKDLENTHDEIKRLTNRS
jgi:hypothetical protein